MQCDEVNGSFAETTIKVNKNGRTDHMAKLEGKKKKIKKKKYA